MERDLPHYPELSFSNARYLSTHKAGGSQLRLQETNTEPCSLLCGPGSHDPLERGGASFPCFSENRNRPFFPEFSQVILFTF